MVIKIIYHLTLDLKQTLENRRSTSAISVRDGALNKNIIESYRTQSKQYSLGSKLSSIREEMKEYCNSMDRFVDDNQIVFKDGEVEGFWGQKRIENSQVNSAGNQEIEKVETDNSLKSGENELPERKSKVEEIIRKQENESEENVMENVQESSSNENNDLDKSKVLNTGGIKVDKDSKEYYSSVNKKQETNDRNIQDTYDLMTLKTCPDIFLDSKETYPLKNTENYDCEGTVRMERPRDSYGVYQSIFTKLKYRKETEKVHKQNISSELMELEKIPDFGKITDSTKEELESSLLDMKIVTDLDDSSEQFSNVKDIAKTHDNNSKSEIIKDNFNVSYDMSPEKNLDESDDDSFKTARSLQEDARLIEEIQESPEIFIRSNKDNDCDKLIKSNKNECELIHNRNDKDMFLNKKPSDVICKDKKSDNKAGGMYDNEMTSDKQKLLMKNKKSDSIEPLISTMENLCLEKSSHCSKFTGKRIHEDEGIEVSKKKYILMEEINPDKKSIDHQQPSQISERCKQHLMQEARKFTQKSSPLIDKYITTLIKNTEGNSQSSHYPKHYQRNLAECLIPDFSVKTKLDKISDNSEKQYKYDNEHNHTMQAYSERKEFMTKQTTNLKSLAPSGNFGKGKNTNT